MGFYWAQNQEYLAFADHMTLAAGLTSAGSGCKRSSFSRQATQKDYMPLMTKSSNHRSATVQRYDKTVV